MNGPTFWPELVGKGNSRKIPKIGQFILPSHPISFLFWGIPRFMPKSKFPEPWGTSANLRETLERFFGNIGKI